MSTVSPSGMSPILDATRRDARQHAHRRAWRIWMTLPVVPCGVAIVAIWRAAGAGPHADDALSRVWAVGVLGWLALSVPVALFWRGYLFAARAAADERVPPATYLAGMSVVWGALASTGLAAAVGCLASGALMPNFAVGLLALMIYFALWPTGDALLRPADQTDDPGEYAEPR